VPDKDPAADNLPQGDQTMITTEFAEHFAAEWVAAWNSHDLNRIMAHYDNDFAMSSPVIVQFGVEPSGTLKGKDNVAAYWAMALAMIPDLQFELISTLVGVNSVTLYYKGPKERLTAEVFHFTTDGTVASASAHYA
jgi:hypothetical protein